MSQNQADSNLNSFSPQEHFDAMKTDTISLAKPFNSPE
jgi:hypothetical protein